jgi:queuine tRNA-ribosyltransferase
LTWKNDTRKQVLYGIVQGDVCEEWRRESADIVPQNDFFGQAIGGSLGGMKCLMHKVIELVGPLIGHPRPTDLPGIWGITDVWNSAKSGIDMFDGVCSIRSGRHEGHYVPHFSVEEKKSCI